MVKRLKCFRRFRVRKGARTFRKRFWSLLKYLWSFRVRKGVGNSEPPEPLCGSQLNTVSFSRSIGPFMISPLSSMFWIHKRRASSTSGRVMICGHLLNSAVGFDCARVSISSHSFNLHERVACVNSSAPLARVRKKLTTSVCVSSGCSSM